MKITKLSLCLSASTIVTQTNGSAIPVDYVHTNISSLEPLLHQLDPNRRVAIDANDIVNDIFSDHELQKRNWVAKAWRFGAIEPPGDGPYSLSFYQGHLLQWIFGDADDHFNISISTCLSSHDVIGRYRFADGHVENDVTGKRIQDDLGFRGGAGSQEQYAARTISNAEASLESAQELLIDHIVCGFSGNLAAYNNFNRALLQHQGTRLAWVGVSSNTVSMALLGLVVSYSDWKWGLKLGIGALLAAMTVIINGLIQQAQARGYLAGPEAYIANSLLAVWNKMIWQALHSPTLDEPCVSETQLTSVVEQVGSFSDPRLGVTNFDDDEGIGLNCVAP